MHCYVTRVLLHDNASELDYTHLHRLMLEAGYSRTITDSDTGKTYHLLPAEYQKTGSNLSAYAVAEEVMRIALRTGKRAAVQVGRSDQVGWLGLEEVKPAPGYAGYYRTALEATLPPSYYGLR